MKRSQANDLWIMEHLKPYAWDYVIKVMADYPDRNDKAVIVQNAISELGPVPNSMGAAVRKAMSNGKNTLDT